MNEILDWLLSTVQAVDPVVRVIVAGLAMMLETSVLVGLIVPGDTIVIVAGTAVDNLAEGTWLVLAILIGSLIGESIGFALGRWLGPRIRFSRVGKLTGERNWMRAELYLRRRGGPAIFLSRFLPVLHSLVPLTVGMSGFAYRRFLAWTVPACTVWSVAYVSVAAAAAEGYRELSDSLHYAGYLFVAVIAAFVLLVYIAKRVISTREARHLELDDAPEARADDVKD
ncbi:DedA family protein [Microbacterium sp. 77mftsu3.1]|uniref:DedA family protein n=1 Tax=Microbacterium sp. 77mftsu3.1 TaxID=1761802 RepID=UPI0003638C0C|nr:DedA family protein [Microbacterium sp. 77mftsu3.1]SDH03378.1 membrane protein DedA, SNARE-associated domain [Microbacterium sp. 77mftsu3.1]